MKTIPIKSGGTAFILGGGETCPGGAVCFMEDEWELAKRLSKGIEGDPERHRAFWATLLEKKQTLPGYLLFMDFPVETPKEEKNAGLKICSEIIEHLRGKGYGPTKKEQV